MAVANVKYIAVHCTVLATKAQRTTTKTTTMTPTLNYYHSRGITPARCVCQCQELGLNPANWSHLSTAFEILKTKYALRNY